MTSRIFEQLDALADPTRCRLLFALDRQELAVHELKTALQLPQSTISRHLKVLSDRGWIQSRASGATNWYRPNRNLDPAARRLWIVVRDQFGATPPAQRDATRIDSVVASRRSRTQEFFTASAASWDRLRAEYFGQGVEMLALGGLLDTTATVADLGCGTGQLTEMIAPMVDRVIAVDESAAMLAAAASRLGTMANVDIRRGALESLPIETSSIDVAFVILVLHHLTEPGKAIDEAARTLKAGGRLVIVDMMPHEHAEYRETMGHQWLGFEEAAMERWLVGAQLSDPTYRALRPQPAARGPLLFLSSAKKSEGSI